MDEYTDIFNARGHAYNEASSDCPHAREYERQAVIHRLELKRGQRVADAPAGGGYVADGIRNSLGQRVEVTCIEPASRFAAAIENAHQVVIAPLHETGLADESYDAIASLAGLHHVLDRDAVYREWRRLLLPGGRLVVADVEEGTKTAEFLNGFVHMHTPGGHEGVFLHDGELTERLEQTGFAHVNEHPIDVPWRSRNVNEMAQFCRKLFAIEAASPELVLEGLRSIVGTDESSSKGVSLNWQLRIATAQK